MLKFITGNKSKFEEISLILSPLKLGQLKIDLAEIQELDPYKIIKHKVSEAFKHHKGEFIIEDASLYFECLGYKLPGPFIKWFTTTIGNDGILKLVENSKKFKAFILVIIAYARNKNNVVFFEAKTRGKIVKPKGKWGFSFDPIFLPDGEKKTLAELKQNRLFDFSARGTAARKLKKYLLKHGDIKAKRSGAKKNRSRNRGL